jgi:hypothetical protein
MPVAEYFPASYSEAREKFAVAARYATDKLFQYRLPDKWGPRGEALVVDVARIGSESVESLLVIISGTHGVEGFCGSGCQVGYLTDRLYDALSPKSAVVLVHALNPFGFASLRRVNEDNVDLNRNFHDFSKPRPPSSAYEALHHLLIPEDWRGDKRQAADAALLEQIKEKGFSAVQAAITGGQYTQPNGLFYGGNKVTWSNKTLREILATHVNPAIKKIAVLDLHTGLGPAGFGEPIYLGPTVRGFDLAKKWYGPEVKSTLPENRASEDESVSSVLSGTIAYALPPSKSELESIYLALEFGTIPPLDVLTALRGDNWLHAVQSCDPELRDEIKRGIREAFYIDTFWWKAAVYGRFSDFALRATRALKHSTS